MLNGMISLWFALTAVFAAFVVIDIWRKPESRVLKFGFALFALFTGVIGTVVYVWGCREPLSGLHEQYARIRWRQALGATMQCVAGGGFGIIVGATLAPSLGLYGIAEVALEYALGFLIVWSVFRGLFLYEVAGAYLQALRSTFVPELLSINFLMAAVVPTMWLLMLAAPQSQDRFDSAFWFVMSTALIVGFIAAYPINSWLVAHHLKRGRMTVRPRVDLVATTADSAAAPADRATSHERATTRQIVGMTVLSFFALSGGVAIGAFFGL